MELGVILFIKKPLHIVSPVGNGGNRQLTDAALTDSRSEHSVTPTPQPSVDDNHPMSQPSPQPFVDDNHPTCIYITTLST